VGGQNRLTSVHKHDRESNEWYNAEPIPPKEPVINEVMKLHCDERADPLAARGFTSRMAAQFVSLRCSREIL
jgi:hypothetical protein